MINTAQELINEFAHLPIEERKKALSLLLRDALDVESPELSDEGLTLNAEELFLELDIREEADAKS